MARKVTVNMYMTVDGRGEFPKYPGSDVVPKKPDAQFTEMWVKRYRSVDTVVMGRRSFEGHLRVHSEAARKPEDPEYMFEYSRWLDRVQKICLSHLLKETKWQNSRIMSGDLGEIIAELKAQPYVTVGAMVNHFNREAERSFQARHKAFIRICLWCFCVLVAIWLLVAFTPMTWLVGLWASLGVPIGGWWAMRHFDPNDHR